MNSVSSGRFDGIDVLRGLSIILVILHHINIHMGANHSVLAIGAVQSTTEGVVADECGCKSSGRNELAPSFEFCLRKKARVRAAAPQNLICEKRTVEPNESSSP